MHTCESGEIELGQDYVVVSAPRGHRAAARLSELPRGFPLRIENGDRIVERTDLILDLRKSSTELGALI
jgi:hypothetical protein